MSELQELLADAMDSLSELQGVWSFGSQTFAGAADALRPNDARMVGSNDRILELRVQTSLFRYPYPRRGNELTSEGITYRVSRVDHDAITGISTLLLVQATSMEPTSQDGRIAFSSGFSLGFL